MQIPEHIRNEKGNQHHDHAGQQGCRHASAEGEAVEVLPCLQYNHRQDINDAVHNDRDQCPQGLLLCKGMPIVVDQEGDNAHQRRGQVQDEDIGLIEEPHNAPALL